MISDTEQLGRGETRIGSPERINLSDYIKQMNNQIATAMEKSVMASSACQTVESTGGGSTFWSLAYEYLSAHNMLPEQKRNELIKKLLRSPNNSQDMWQQSETLPKLSPEKEQKRLRAEWNNFLKTAQRLETEQSGLINNLPPGDEAAAALLISSFKTIFDYAPSGIELEDYEPRQREVDLRRNLWEKVGSDQNMDSDAKKRLGLLAAAYDGDVLHSDDGNYYLWPTSQGPYGAVEDYTVKRKLTQAEKFFDVKLVEDFALSLLDFSLDDHLSQTNHIKNVDDAKELSFDHMATRNRGGSGRLGSAVQLEHLFGVRPERLTEWAKEKIKWAEDIQGIENEERYRDKWFNFKSSTPEESLAGDILLGNMFNGDKLALSYSERPSTEWLLDLARADWDIARRLGAIDELVKSHDLPDDLSEKLFVEDPTKVIVGMTPEEFNFGSVDAKYLNNQLDDGGELLGAIVLNHHKFPQLEFDAERVNGLIDKMIELAKQVSDAETYKKGVLLQNINYILQIAHTIEGMELNEELLQEILIAERDCEVEGDPVHLLSFTGGSAQRTYKGDMIHAFYNESTPFGIETFQMMLERLTADEDRLHNLQYYLPTLLPLFDVRDNNEEEFKDALREVFGDKDWYLIKRTKQAINRQWADFMLTGRVPRDLYADSMDTGRDFQISRRIDQAAKAHIKFNPSYSGDRNDLTDLDNYSLRGVRNPYYKLNEEGAGRWREIMANPIFPEVETPEMLERYEYKAPEEK